MSAPELQLEKRHAATPSEQPGPVYSSCEIAPVRYGLYVPDRKLSTRRSPGLLFRSQAM